MQLRRDLALHRLIQMLLINRLYGTFYEFVAAGHDGLGLGRSTAEKLTGLIPQRLYTALDFGDGFPYREF